MKEIQTIDGSEQLRLIRCGVIREAEALLRDITRSLAGLQPACLVALASSRYSDLPAEQAFVMLKGDVATLLRALEANSEELQADLNAERERLAVVVAAAAHRSIEIAAVVERIAGRIRSGQSFAEGKRERLRQAGLTGDDLDRAAAPFDPSALHAERDALLAEQDALELFLKTRNAAHLPAGFVEQVRDA